LAFKINCRSDTIGFFQIGQALALQIFFEATQRHFRIGQRYDVDAARKPDPIPLKSLAIQASFADFHV
jgi:hypothetical protein